MLSAGRLRHRVDIQESTPQQDPVTGEVTEQWTTVHANVPAAIEPMSVREFLAARQMQGEVSVLIVMRFIPGLHEKMRIMHGDTVYNPTGFLPDKKSNIEYVTAPCSTGVNEG